MRQPNKSKNMQGIGNHQFKKNLDKYRTSEWLYKKYWSEELSISEIAKIVGVSLACIHKWMKKVNISRRKDGSRTGIHHNRFKGWHINSQGYKLILMHEHPKSNKQGYIREHILVCEKVIGRYLTEEETAHHINENKSDNRPNNLFLFKTKHGHQRYHWDIHKKNPIKKSNLSTYV